MSVAKELEIPLITGEAVAQVTAVITRRPTHGRPQVALNHKHLFKQQRLMQEEPLHTALVEEGLSAVQQRT